MVIDNFDEAIFRDNGAPYAIDNDQWTWQIADWYNVAAPTLVPHYLSPASGGDEPMPDAFVVNNLFDGVMNIHASKHGGSVRVRVINAAALSMFTVSVDGMPLLLVELDGTSVTPLTLPFITLNVAQRASFVLDWNLMDAAAQSSSSIRFRVTTIAEMYPTFDESDPNLGLYGSSSGLPLKTQWTGLIRFGGEEHGGEHGGEPNYAEGTEFEAVSSLAPALDMNTLQARPIVPRPAPPATHTIEMLVVFEDDDSGVNTAYINGETHPVEPYINVTTHVLRSFMNPPQTPSPDIINTADNVNSLTPIPILGSGTIPFVLPYKAVVEVTIINTDGGDHPFHVHGHNFWIVSASDAPDAASLYEGNYLQRDVVTVPAEGNATIRFIADNPGGMDCIFLNCFPAVPCFCSATPPDLCLPSFIALAQFGLFTATSTGTSAPGWWPSLRRLPTSERHELSFSKSFGF
jgi:FtsP/CotA-like multicopper oxidase with cupredoxin domain